MVNDTNLGLQPPSYHPFLHSLRVFYISSISIWLEPALVDTRGAYGSFWDNNFAMGNTQPKGSRATVGLLVGRTACSRILGLVGLLGAWTSMTLLCAGTRLLLGEPFELVSPFAHRPTGESRSPNLSLRSLISSIGLTGPWSVLCGRLARQLGLPHTQAELIRISGKSRNSAIFFAKSSTGLPGSWSHQGQVLATSTSNDYNLSPSTGKPSSSTVYSIAKRTGTSQAIKIMGG
ncbi:hypothetical protein AG1IA_06774 [Rhizoctonia solani AG-1 IA]|uniref:Uncharacterized protein n=1 Tax=Thanatephorus cucumeris (strain AG1-IA) TaxID=983506 RepID=L8WS32_THACA|nr:hypothetical protein AG1IA_06774 [Rhizoctonia solani AG-1 IA]